MSKHPTRDLSPKDIACIEYGKRLKELRSFYALRHKPKTFNGSAETERLLKEAHFHNTRRCVYRAREARERIFRHCVDCRFSKSFSLSGWDCSKVSERHGGNYACICPHYEERGEE